MESNLSHYGSELPEWLDEQITSVILNFQSGFSWGKLAPLHRPCVLLWLEIQHCYAMLQVDWHRILMVYDQPLAVNLLETGGPTQPEIGLELIAQGLPYPVEAVDEGKVIDHNDI